jgi:SAM-dependent methyltransferase
MARWDKLWRDDAYVARNWIEPDPDIVRLSPVMQGRGVQRVLDLGCGPGRHVLYLSRQGCEMHGLDISAAGVERCRKALEQQHLTATVQVADMLSIPYPDAHFDWVLSVQVIYHTTAATLKQALQHVRVKLKPGGFFYVTFPPVENIVPESGREIEPRTYLQEEDGEPLLHHYVLPERCVRASDAAVTLERIRAKDMRVCNEDSRRRWNHGECPWVVVQFWS